MVVVLKHLRVGLLINPRQDTCLLEKHKKQIDDFIENYD